MRQTKRHRRKKVISTGIENRMTSGFLAANSEGKRIISRQELNA